MIWQSVLTTIAFSILGYLIGSVSFSILFSKIFKKEDIRTKSSGNAGATNSMRNYGFGVGVLIMVLDMAKPILAIIIAYVSSLFMHGDWKFIVLEVVGFFAVVGHIYPVFFNFKGGKGAASYAGFLLILSWPLFFIGLITFVAVLLITKKASLASILGLTLTWISQILFSVIPHMSDGWAHMIPFWTPWWVGTIMLLLTIILVFFMHRGNIKRLFNGTERKIGQK